MLPSLTRGAYPCKSVYIWFVLSQHIVVKMHCLCSRLFWLSWFRRDVTPEQNSGTTPKVWLWFVGNNMRLSTDTSYAEIDPGVFCHALDGSESGCDVVLRFPFHSLRRTRTCTLVQLTGRALGLQPHSREFILTCMSVLCLSKMCSASPVFPLQVGSQIKLSSTGSGAYKHTRQAEWLVMTFQTFTPTLCPNSGPCGQIS